jgi:hypothetical protein
VDFRAIPKNMWEFRQPEAIIIGILTERHISRIFMAKPLGSSKSVLSGCLA